LNMSKLLTREFIHYHGTINSLPLVYGVSSDISPIDVNKILELDHIKKLERYALEDKNINVAKFKPGDIVYAQGPPDPSQKSTFAVHTRGPFQILTVDDVTKTISAKMHNSKLTFPLPFEKINKVSLSDINLDLFKGFLDPKEKRDFNMRPRLKPPTSPLHLSDSESNKRITRSQENNLYKVNNK